MLISKKETEIVSKRCPKIISLLFIGEINIL